MKKFIVTLLIFSTCLLAGCAPENGNTDTNALTGNSSSLAGNGTYSYSILHDNEYNKDYIVVTKSGGYGVAISITPRITD